jgi:RNA-binding protein Musashi
MSSYTEEEAAKPAAAPKEIKNAPVIEAEIKNDEPEVQNEPADQPEENTYNGDQEMDDDIDFNLGGGNDYDQAANSDSHGPGIKEDG